MIQRIQLAANDYFTSDTHLGHINILKHDCRPFANIHEHDVALINNIKEKVPPTGRIFHLGDFYVGRGSKSHIRYKIKNILEQLSPRKVILIFGNHDHWSMGNEFYLAQPYLELTGFHPNKNEKIHIVLSHYAQRVWNRSHHGSYHFFGHSHGKLPPYGRSFDVGINKSYYPYSLEEVLKEIEPMEYIKHH